MKQICLKIIYRVLAFYARKVIKRHKPVVVAITGSVGKTSTKEAIYQVLSDAYGKDEVSKNYGNLNAEIGIPLTILGYQSLPNKFLWPIFLIGAFRKTWAKKYPKYLILEMGVEHPGDIKYFMSIVRPNFAVITSTNPAHIANFQNHESFQKEKASIISYVNEGKSILNCDDEFLAKQNKDDTVTFGIKNETAMYRADSIKLTTEGTEFRINSTGHKIAVKSHLLGAQLIYGQLAAFALADQLSLSLINTGKSLEKLKSLSGRMNLVEGKNNVIIIDDTYNSNPASAKAAIDSLYEIESSYRKIAILGNMNELGSLEKEAHKTLGEYIKGKCDLAIFVGKNAELMAEGYSDKKSSMVFSSRTELTEKLSSIISKNDLILIKASQNGNYFEEITKKLMKNPEDATKILVRQDGIWKRKKKN